MRFFVSISKPPPLIASLLSKVGTSEDHQEYHDLVDGLELRSELATEMHSLRPDAGVYESSVSLVMKKLYDERMKLTGQNGLSDYDVGFTNFLWTFQRSPDARQEMRWFSF